MGMQSLTKILSLIALLTIAAAALDPESDRVDAIVPESEKNIASDGLLATGTSSRLATGMYTVPAGEHMMGDGSLMKNSDMNPVLLTTVPAGDHVMPNGSIMKNSDMPSLLATDHVMKDGTIMKNSDMEPADAFRGLDSLVGLVQTTGVTCTSCSEVPCGWCQEGCTGESCTVDHNSKWDKGSDNADAKWKKKPATSKNWCQNKNKGSHPPGCNNQATNAPTTEAPAVKEDAPACVYGDTVSAMKPGRTTPSGGTISGLAPCSTGKVTVKWDGGATTNALSDTEIVSSKCSVQCTDSHADCDNWTSVNNNGQAQDCQATFSMNGETFILGDKCCKSCSNSQPTKMTQAYCPNI